MNINYNLSSRKGQSAIEYLMTYGWMLLVVAIVGGAIFATVQGQCAKQSSGFTGEAMTIETFESTDSNMQIEFTNAGSEQVTIQDVNISDGDGTEVAGKTGMGTTLNVGDSNVVSFSDITSAEACNDYSVKVTFDKGPITDATASGTISGNFA